MLQKVEAGIANAKLLKGLPSENSNDAHRAKGLFSRATQCNSSTQEEMGLRGKPPNLQTLAAHEIITSLEDKLYAAPPIEYLISIVCKFTREKNRSLSLRLLSYMQNTGLDSHKALGNYLVSMLLNVGCVAHAQRIFDMLASRSENSWNALINGYIRSGDPKQALTLYKHMLEDSKHPSGYTFVGLLRVCTSKKDLKMGRDIHADISKEGLLQTNSFVGSALIDMYAKCGSVVEAQQVFDVLPVRTVVTWTALIAGYTQNNQGDQALTYFEKMRCDGITPNAVTYSSVLKACGSMKNLKLGKELHAEVESAGILQTNQYVGNALVDMYARCGMLAKAKSVFSKLTLHDRVSWNALIAGHVEQDQCEKALSYYTQMRQEGVAPDVITYTCILKACGSVGAVDTGKEVHDDIKEAELLREDIFLGCALVDMYAKCGVLSRAQEVFDELPNRDTLTWTALISGYAQQGETEDVLFYFDRMRESGTKPDLVTFLTVLSACNHAGLVDKGEEYYEAMWGDYGLRPSVKHHACIVDLLGRAGQLDRVVAMMKKAPFQPTMVMWLNTLTACRKWGHVELARQAFEQAVRLDIKDSSAYICMANIYADAGMHEDAKKVEARILRKKISENPSHCLWMDVSGTLHSFSDWDEACLSNQEVSAKLEQFSVSLQEQGGFHKLLEDIPDNEKMELSRGHSERFAIACAIVNTPAETSIILLKDTEVCNDCHSALALISRLEKRIIHLRDSTRIHHFDNGSCDCKLE